MEATAAVERLSALAQETRLELFRRLVRRGPEGVAAGEIAVELGIPKPTLSFHLAALERAGLVRSERRGRSILYAADYRAMGELVGFLYENCCAEDGAACAVSTDPPLSTTRKPSRDRARSPQ